MAEEFEEKLDSPLVVHKESDASYRDTANEVSMNATHTDPETSDAPTLERHRFKKVKKKKKWPWFLVALVAIAIAVVCALNYNGVIDLSHKENTTVPSTRKSYTTQAVNKFEGVITVKGTYLFFEGKEVDGIKGLEQEIKYLDANTSFVVQDESADSSFLNYTVLPLLDKYSVKYETKHIVSSGLVSKYEKTTAASTLAASTAKKG